MTDTLISSSSTQDNLIDKAASTATKVLDATKGATTAALDSVNQKVESMRGTLSPALDNALAPVDSVLRFTRDHPISALMASAAMGAVLATLLRLPGRRSR